MNWLIGAIPLVTGYAAGALCPVGESAAAAIPARPPGWVFSVVWPLLYIAMGVAWVRSRGTDPIIDVLFGLLTLLLVLWQYLYGCQGKQRQALYVLVAGIAAALATLVYAAQRERSAAYLLAPLVAWLVFATMLNYTQVNQAALQ